MSTQSEGISLLTSLAGGGIGTITLGALFIVYRICKGRKFHTKSGCIELDITDVEAPPSAPSAVPPTPPSSKRNSVERPAKTEAVSDVNYIV